jgi:hypothetical protein
MIIAMFRGAPKLTAEKIKVVWAEFSTLSFKLGCFTKCAQFMAYTNLAESILENSAHVSSC